MKEYLPLIAIAVLIIALIIFFKKFPKMRYVFMGRRIPEEPEEKKSEGCGCETCKRVHKYFNIIDSLDKNSEDYKFLEGIYIALENTELDKDWNDMYNYVLMEHIKDIVKRYNLPNKELPTIENMNKLREKYQKIHKNEKD